MSAEDPGLMAIGAALAAKVGPGIVGSVLSLRFNNTDAGFKERALAVIGGFSLAYFTAPAITEWVGGSAKVELFIGVLTASLGLVALGELTKAVREMELGKTLRAFLRRKAGLPE